MSGKAGSIGLEDRFLGIKDKKGVREKLVWLIGRLADLVAEDGRKPYTIRITMRDCYKNRREQRKFAKESRQCKIQPRMLEEKEEAVEVALGLVSKMVNFKAEFQLTLLGVAVTDFVEEVESKASIKNFFCTKKAAIMERSNHQLSAASTDPDTTENLSTSQSSSQRNCPERSVEADCIRTSPVLKKSRQSEITDSKKFNESERDNSPPAGCDPGVWAALPSDLQMEVRASKIPELNQDQVGVSQGEVVDVVNTAAVDVTAFNCPPGIDPEVYRMLPEDIKEEIQAEAREKYRRTQSTVEERTGNLFSASPNISLAHCISEDCVMGKGIAKQFAEKFGRLNEIKGQCVKVGGVAILKQKERYIYNLVTKKKYYEKPTFADLRSSLLQMRKHMKENGVEGVAMPKIGCGLDLLDWLQVKRLLKEVFENSGFNIVVYTGLSSASTKPKTNESVLKYFSKK